MDRKEFNLQNEKNMSQELINEKQRKIQEIKNEGFSKETESKLIDWVNRYCDLNSLEKMKNNYSEQFIKKSGKKEMQSILDSATFEDRKRNLLLISSNYETNCLLALLSILR